MAIDITKREIVEHYLFLILTLPPWNIHDKNVKPDSDCASVAKPSVYRKFWPSTDVYIILSVYKEKNLEFWKLHRINNLSLIIKMQHNRDENLQINKTYRSNTICNHCFDSDLNK